MEPLRPGPWRYLLAALLASSFLLAYALAGALSAPDVPATCTKLLELVEQAGERVEQADREACEQRYEQVRGERGLLGWAKLARCVEQAATIPDAGGC